jgi:phosphoribosylaminoimidazolecarboxamide formyltransferase/IMP cyclohydrolase
MYADPKYSAITEDKFPPVIEISFVQDQKRQTLVFEKVSWPINDRRRSLRYGDNPGQASALYRLTNGNLLLGDVENISPGKSLASDPEIIQQGKHPGKINIFDADRSLALLRSLADRPSVAIIKHGNPSGVAHADTLEKACTKAIECDRVGTFGGCVGLNGTVDKGTAQAILSTDVDVVVAPDYDQGVMDIFAKRPSMCVLRIRNMERLGETIFQPVVDFSSLSDGGLIVQWTQVPKQIATEDLKPATASYEGKIYRCRREVAASDRDDMMFAWKVACAMSSNAVVFAKNGATVGVGNGQQDSTTASEVARDKAYRNLADHIALKRFSKTFSKIENRQMIESIMNDVQELRGGLIGAIMASDAFFPSPEGILLAKTENVAGIIQPGGATLDYRAIEVCNEAQIPMVFTGERSFVG